MLAISDPPVQKHSHLRPLDVRRDLLSVANLIELCFASTMDPDGKEYLRQLRRLAQDEHLVRWASPEITERIPMPVSGYVWEEEGRIVGNLSLIPLQKQGERTFMIANVAVHPDFRRRGIARALTQQALEHSQRRGARSAWLQVRKDNPGAHDLYESLGFQDRSARTTWLSSPGYAKAPTEPQVTVDGRRRSDWPQHLAWLMETYPADVRWNLPLDIGRMKPDLLNSIAHFLLNDQVRHWVARQSGQLIGVLSWEASPAYSDSLWLATTPENEDQAIRAILPRARAELPYRRSLSLNYPFDRGVSAFSAAGFYPHQTLIWMEAELSVTRLA